MRLLTRHSPLSLVLLVLSLIGCALVGAAAYAVPGYRLEETTDTVAFWLLLGAMIACSVVVFLVRRSTAYRSALAGFAGVAFGFAALFPEMALCYAAILVLCTLLTALYERYPGNLIASLSIVVVISVVYLLARGAVAEGEALRVAGLRAAVPAFLGITIAIFGSLVGRYRYELADMQVVQDGLAENVVELTRANVQSLGLATSAEEQSKRAERMRLTSEIHDLIGYTLTTNITLMEAVIIMQENHPERVPDYVEMIRSNTSDALEKIRAVLRDIRAEEEPEPDLHQLLRKLKVVFEFSTGVDVEYVFGTTKIASLEPYRKVVYNFIQEAMINAFRHGRATSVRVFFWDDSDQYSVAVRDNGVGTASVSEDVGISAMRERAESLAGRVVIPRVKNGFSIEMHLPKIRSHADAED